MIERLFHALCTGNRRESRMVLGEIESSGLEPEEIAHEVYWPILESVQAMFRADQLSMLAHHYACRLLRSLADQTQARFNFRSPRQRKILMFCGASEVDELAGQITADLLEADGYDVFFGGGGIANDEILAEVGEHQPDVLLLFSSGASDAPNIRLMIDKIRTVNSCPNMQIVVGGGVFNRADGLAEEIGADLWARTPRELVEVLDKHPERRATPEQRTVGRTRQSGRSAVA